jgi:hypothetical protein
MYASIVFDDMSDRMYTSVRSFIHLNNVCALVRILSYRDIDSTPWIYDAAVVVKCVYAVDCIFSLGLVVCHSQSL